jgi:hypothetical protein
MVLIGKVEWCSLECFSSVGQLVYCEMVSSVLQYNKVQYVLFLIVRTIAVVCF